MRGGKRRVPEPAGKKEMPIGAGVGIAAGADDCQAAAYGSTEWITPCGRSHDEVRQRVVRGHVDRFQVRGGGQNDCMTRSAEKPGRRSFSSSRVIAGGVLRTDGGHLRLRSTHRGECRRRRGDRPFLRQREALLLAATGLAIRNTSLQRQTSTSRALVVSRGR